MANSVLDLDKPVDSKWLRWNAPASARLHERHHNVFNLQIDDGYQGTPNWWWFRLWRLHNRVRMVDLLYSRIPEGVTGTFNLGPVGSRRELIDLYNRFSSEPWPGVSISF